MRLTSFELNFTSQWDEQDDLEPLVRFVKSFEGLEDLYISFPARADSGLQCAVDPFFGLDLEDYGLVE
jgi:hypothetical protein